MLKFIFKNLNFLCLVFCFCLAGLFGKQFGFFITCFFNTKGVFFYSLNS